jgi:hypothetical protein
MDCLRNPLKSTLENDFLAYKPSFIQVLTDFTFLVLSKSISFLG